MRSLRLLLPVLVSFSLATACSEDPCAGIEVPAGATLDETARTVLDACLRQSGAPSGSIAVMRGDEIGVAVAGPLRPGGPALEGHHLLRVGSVTKTFTATLVLKLAEEGRISLDDRIGTYVEGVPNGDRITLEQLLRMTSGLPNYTSIEAVQSAWGRPWSHEALLAEVRKTGAADEPGDTFAYNNTGYYLLGLVVEKVTGQGFDDALRERVLVPAGIADDVVLEGSERFEPDRLAAGMHLDGTLVTDGCDPSVPFTAGALVATPEALLRFVAALDSHRLLGEASLDKMRTAGPVQSLVGSDYAIGAFRMKHEGRDVFGHPGGHPSGAVAWWLSEPRAGVRVFAQFNTAEATAKGAAESALSALLR